MTSKIEFASARYDPKRCSDRIEALTEQLAFEKKRGAALLCTITRLEGEVAQAARANAQLVQTIMELRQRGNGMEQLTTAVAELRKLK